MKLIGKYTLGTNVTFTWTVLTNGEAVSLEGRDLSVICTDVFHRTIPISYVVVGNDVTVSVLGEDQISYGLLVFQLLETVDEVQRIVDVRGIELVPVAHVGEDGQVVDTEINEGITAAEISFLREIETNEALRIQAENDRVTAEISRVQAEEARVAADEERASRQVMYDDAEHVRVQNENLRKAAERARQDAEEQRETFELIRQQSEDDRDAAEQARVAAESVRQSAEGIRTSAEGIRTTAENSRASAESSRVSAEAARVTAEQARVAAENNRASAESSRVSAETNRASAESSRTSAESARVLAESARVLAEQQREVVKAEMEQMMEDATMGEPNVQADWNETDTTSDAYILNKPDISGLYQKPASGIPKTDLASAVQTSLGKADAAAPQSTTYTKEEVDNMLISSGTPQEINYTQTLANPPFQPIALLKDKQYKVSVNVAANDISKIRSIAFYGSQTGSSLVYSKTIDPLTGEVTFTFTPENDVNYYKVNFISSWSGTAYVNIVATEISDVYLPIAQVPAVIQNNKENEVGISFNVFGDVLPPSFKNRMMSGEDDILVVCQGDSITGLTQNCELVDNPSHACPGGQYRSWVSMLQNQVSKVKPYYNRLDSVRNEQDFFTKNGTWSQATSDTFGPNGDPAISDNSKEASVTALTYRSNSNDASLSFVFDADTYDKCNLVFSKNKDAGSMGISILEGNGQMLASIDRINWVEANGFTHSQSTITPTADNGEAACERHRRLWLKKASKQEINYTQTLYNPPFQPIKLYAGREYTISVKVAANDISKIRTIAFYGSQSGSSIVGSQTIDPITGEVTFTFTPESDVNYYKVNFISSWTGTAYVNIIYKTAITGQLHITYHRTANDGTYVYFWGTEMYNGRAILFDNIGRGGRTIGLLAYNISDVFDRNPDLTILEMPLANDLYHSTTVEGLLSAYDTYFLGESGKSYKSRSDNYETPILIMLPHTRASFFDVEDGAVMGDSSIQTIRTEPAYCIYKEVFGYLFESLKDYPNVGFVNMCDQFLNEAKYKYDSWHIGLSSGNLTADSTHPNQRGSDIYAKYLAAIFDNAVTLKPSSGDIYSIKALTQDEYDSLNPDPNTLYIIIP